MLNDKFHYMILDHDIKYQLWGVWLNFDKLCLFYIAASACSITFSYIYGHVVHDRGHDTYDFYECMYASGEGRGRG